MTGEASNLILYTTDDGKATVSLMSRDGRVWLNQKQMAELFAVSKMNVSHHIANILQEGELDDSVVKHYFTTAADGKAPRCPRDDSRRGGRMEGVRP
jgi:hypothetical protein